MMPTAEILGTQTLIGNSLRPCQVITCTNTKCSFVLTFVNSPCLVNTKAEFTFVRISDLQNKSFECLAGGLQMYNSK